MFKSNKVSRPEDRSIIDIDVKPKEEIENREEKGRTRKNRGRTGDTHGQARSCGADRMGRNGTNSEEQGTHGQDARAGTAVRCRQNVCCSSGLREFEIE